MRPAQLILKQALYVLTTRSNKTPAADILLDQKQLPALGYDEVYITFIQP